MMAAKIGSRNTCTSCFGTGSCAQCDGSGLTSRLNVKEGPEKCRNCSGTGICLVCNGSGAWMTPPPEIIDLGLLRKS